MNQKRFENEFNCPQWIKVLNENTNGNASAVEVLQDFAGLCRDPRTCYGPALILTGKGVGKTIYANILREIVGRDNTSEISIPEFDDQFSRAMLKDKWLNFSRLEHAEELESPFFKGIVTGDSITGSFKYEDPFDFSPFCKLLFETAKTVDISNLSAGIYRRCICVQFKNQPSTPSCGLLDTLLEEMDGIKLWADEGRKRLIEQGRLIPRVDRKMKKTDSVKETIEIETDLINRLWKYATMAKNHFDQFPPKSIEFMEKDHNALSEALREMFTKHLKSKAPDKFIEIPNHSYNDLLLKEIRTINKTLQVLVNQDKSSAIKMISNHE